jgi:putative ABC transport system permease protein
VKIKKPLEVAGVVKDTPENSYIEFDVLLSMRSIPAVERLHWSWIWTQLETFVRLAPHTNLEATQAKLEQIPRKHAEETLQRIMNMSFDDYIKSGKKLGIVLTTDDQYSSSFGCGI